MMRRVCTAPRLSLIVAAFAGTALLACGRHTDKAANAGDSAATTANASGGSDNAAAPAASPAPGEEPDVTAANLTLADLDIYQQGLGGRIDAVNKMHADVAKAHSATDSLRIMQQASLEKSDTALAKKFNVSVRHVDNVVKFVGDLLLSFKGQGMANNAIGQMDTTNMNADQKAQAREMIAQLRQHTDSDANAATAGMAPPVAAELAKRRQSLEVLRDSAMKVVFGR